MTPPQQRMYRFLMVTSIAATIGMMGWVTLLSNFAVESAGLGPLEIGITQSIREIPGFLSLLVIYLLLVLTEHRAAALSILVMGLGVSITGYLPSFWGVVCSTLIMSTGFHFFEPLNQSLSLQYFSLEAAPIMLSRLRAAMALANIGVGGVIFALSGWLGYPTLFLLIGAVVTGIGVWAVLQDPSDKSMPPQHKKMLFRWKYWLYYALTFLSGSRRQIFMVFATFLLVKKFELSLMAISGLFMVNNIIAWAVNPVIGRMINRYGERALLTVEYSTLIVVFLGYSYTESPYVAGALFIMDHLAFNFVVCIRTYLQKIADRPDIAPSSAVGFTINHIAAVVIPALGGWLWTIDYHIPFLAGAVMAAISLVLSQFVRTPGPVAATAEGRASP
ncbi:MFS transporter [Megalodesulfovibrio gigas]|uniref:Putative major facilitator superfamily protein n=1 Tax=Megalodesulfovibrio gigas (strain ATCC 19364 / DSM 1382 / NCIMB 9332 / VKM B-1759) TaxID=1121448 RepID=T2GBS7_MEGG1|nr:MFS transporter [Megalodesulfovibrio gigas]AGW13614.1 putative major facilitator superfamily protein [Megalodesulfovibrio gigas DSM 1382 = ATCC 19364]